MDTTKENTNNNSKKKVVLGIFFVIACAGILFFMFYLRYKSTHITTDDAYIDGRIHTIASRASGIVKNVYVSTNQFVKNGDILVDIDAADYDVTVREEESRLNAEISRKSEIESKIIVLTNQLAELGYMVETAKANVELQEAKLRQADLDIKRATDLLKKEALSKEKYEKIKTDYDIVFAQAKASREQLKQAKSTVETQKSLIKQTELTLQSQNSLIKQREAELSSAELKKSYTKIYSPSDGYVTKKSVEIGNLIQVGQPLMAVVALDDIWVTANYKETQLTYVKSGQKVKIEVDTFSKKEFDGKVDSIMAGTGSIFSLFPPENATGNFVKVVQRIPVKIVFDKNADTEHLLRLGMSVVPTIYIEK